MKTFLKLIGLAFAAGVLLVVLLVAGAVWTSGSLEPGSISLDGDTLVSGLGIGEWLMAIGGLTLAALIVALIVPIAVLVPLAILGVVLVGVLVALAGVVAVVCSPLLLFAAAVWLVWRLLRRGRRDGSAPGGGATIGG
ncbi:MAG TPA: hypothetical protein VNU71_17800 [Burkholderiaceae bacterium]|nr:hypothetical protein [Burkholderiaceae bacterium]